MPRSRLLLLIIFFISPLTQGWSGERHRWAVGANYGGGQLDWRPTPRWAFEFRAQAGHAAADFEVRGETAGARIYRYFLVNRNPQFYAGLEADSVSAAGRDVGAPLRARGVAAGAFMGLEVFWTRRLSFGFDIGPYFLSLKESQTGVSHSQIDFVADACVKVHFL
jgi:hypothetical protein